MAKKYDSIEELPEGKVAGTVEWTAPKTSDRTGGTYYVIRVRCRSPLRNQSVRGHMLWPMEAGDEGHRWMEAMLGRKLSIEEAQNVTLREMRGREVYITVEPWETAGGRYVPVIKDMFPFDEDVSDSELAA